MDRSADGCMSAMQPIHGSSHLQPTSSPSSPAVALSRLLQLIAALIQHHSTSMRIPTKNLFFCPSVPTRHDQSLTKCSQFHLPFCERRTLGDVAIMVRGVVVWAVKRLHDLSLSCWFPARPPVKPIIFLHSLWSIRFFIQSDKVQAQKAASFLVFAPSSVTELLSTVYSVLLVQSF